jgi:hypothetical protein
MEHDHDFSALRNLLALHKLQTPMDTEVNRFLIEFHRRQRAQLLAPKSRWARVMVWLQQHAEGIRLVPSLSYASSFVAAALLVFAGFSQQVHVRPSDGSHDKLALGLPSSDAALAVSPVAFVRDSSVTSDNSLSFNPAAPRTGATRFVLANTRVAYDATAAF